ncbi:hypothetical protein HWV62_18100 [Athelia sp. TMB]|nr:hypothetical protein HWV62_18100 [Athelia sp. TMB]
MLPTRSGYTMEWSTRAATAQHKARYNSLGKWDPVWPLWQAIAVHTFVGVLWGKLGKNFLFAYCVVAITWIFVALSVALGVSLHTNSTEQFDTPNGFWCWIGDKYKAEQIAGEYVWMWVTMFVSFITYSLLFLWARGNLTVSPTQWWSIRIHRASSERIDPSGGKVRSAKMIAYPIVFAIVVLPPTVVRFHYGFGSQRHIPNAWAFIIQFVFCLSGALNVLLFLTTRSGLLLPKAALGKTAPLWQPADEDEEKGQSHLNIDAESLRHSDVANARPVERGERPMALAALPGVEDISDEW